MVLHQILLALSGDIETNPGPAREKKPDPKKVMEEKVNAHDDKIAALEKILKKQKKMVEIMSDEQTTLQKALEDSKVEFDKSLEENRLLSDNLEDLKTELGEINFKQVTHCYLHQEQTD